MRTLFLLSCAAISACASAPEEEISVDVLAGPPPSFAQLKAEIDTSLTCASEHEVRPLQPDPRRPTFVSRCVGYFPAILQKAEIEGACISMFDIDANGAPILVATRCNASKRWGQEPPEAWLSVAKQAFEYSANLATSRHRFRPVADAGSEKRENLAQPMRFQFEGEPDFIARPDAFQRPPPAPQALELFITKDVSSKSQPWSKTER